MPSTNKTDKLQLSQFEPTDKPSFIQDYNADMQKLDTAIFDAQSEATEAKQSATGNSQEIREIKNELDNIGLPFRYFQYGEEERLSTSPITTRGNGIGNTDAIQSIDNLKVMRANRDGIYIIWSNIQTSLFGKVSEKAIVQAGLYVSNPDPTTGGIKHTMLVTRPLISGTEYPEHDVAQTFHLPPTAIRMETGSQFYVIFNVEDTGGQENMENAYQKYASVGVIKIG